MKSLTKEQLDLCISITQNLRKCPGAEAFNNPVDPKKHNLKDYNKVIHNPQDLGTILKRLEDGKYDSVVQWERDISTVWSNAETYNGEDALVSKLAHHMSKRFQKLKRPLETLSVAGWTKYIYNLRYQFDTILSSPPPSLTSISARLSKQIPQVEKFSSKDVNLLIKANDMFNTPSDVEAVASILKKNDPPISFADGEPYIDVNILTSATLHDLRDYFRRQCAERSLPYPQ